MMSLMHPVAAEPESEVEQHATSHGLRLDTDSELYFNALCRTAQRLFSVPLARIELCETRMSSPACGSTFCVHALLSDDVLVVEDASRDPRFQEDAFVTGESSVKFYAGAPLVLGPGVRVGTVSIMDTVPRSLSGQEAAALADLATIAVAQLQRVDSARSCAEPAGRLSQAHELLSMVEHLAQIGHWRIETVTGHLRSSAGFEAIFGRGSTQSRLDLEAHLAALHPDDRERTRRQIKLLTSGEIDAYEHQSRIFRPDGEMRVIIARALAQRSDDGRVSAVFGACVDITEATKSEQLLRERTALLTNTLDNMDEGLFVVDADHRLVLSNRRGTELFDLPCDLATTQSMPAELVELQDTDVERVSSRLGAREVCLGATGVRDIREFTRPNGTIIEVRSMRIEDGSSVLTCADVTARRRAEAALQASETLHRFLTETVTDIIIRRDVRGQFVYLSPVSLDVLGYAPGELRERSFEGLVHPDDLDAMVGAISDLRAGQANQACFSYRFQHKDGRWVWIESRSRLIRNSAGMPVEVISTLRDVTDRVAVEQRLRDSEERLALALSSGTDGLFDWNVVTDEIWLSGDLRQQFSDDLQYAVSAQTFISKAVEPADIQVVESAVREHFEGRTPSMTVECRLRVSTTDQISVLVRGKVVDRRADGTPLRMVGTVIDITDRRDAEARIAHLARHDPLTDLPNRSQFHEQLEARLAEIRRHGGTLAVLCLDLDRFKAVNDTLGQPVGDAVLRAIADRLRRTVLQEDMVARLGGDEFAILASDFNPSQPRRLDSLAARLIEVVNEPVMFDGFCIEVGLTVGIAIAPDDGEAADALFKRADLALCRGKNEVRNTFRFFEAGTDEIMAERRCLELDLRNAIAREELELYYQPVMDISRGRMSGFEALLRWRHPERGLVSPADVIPIAEETGLIIPIGEWVLRTACRQAMEWADTSLKVSVNVSAMQVRHHSLIDNIMAALEQSGLPAERLELEITESVLIGSGDAVLSTVQQIRAMGIRIALDDFGTGYSSLSYLHRFPFDRVKIDRSFVKEISSPKTAAIVRATVDLAQRLGMAVTAEGIETSEQLNLVHAEGCIEIQGYLISRPVSAADATSMASGETLIYRSEHRSALTICPDPAVVH